MGVTKINLDNLVSYYIHRPILSGKGTDGLPPLYARSGTESESTYDSEGMKNLIWQNNSKNTYNSPTNIRRLFIGGHKVYIQYYQPYISNGASSGRYWVEYTYSSKDDIGELAKNIANSQSPDTVQFTKTGLGALSSHWKVSNIEELFITPDILLSYDVMQWMPNAIKIYQIAVRSNPGSLFKDQTILGIFEKVNGGNIQSIRSRYPRLKTLGLITNIEQMMKVENAQNLREGLPTSLSDLGQRWVSHANKIGATKLGTCIICDVPFESKSSLFDFAVRPGIYRFDAEVLSPYVEKYKSRVLELGRMQRDKKSGKAVEEEDKQIKKSEFEVYLDELSDKFDINIVQGVIKLGMSAYNSEEIDKEFSLMTEEGRLKYRKLLGR